MGRVTNIAWTHHTFNPWIGCRRVSPACEHCYAEWFVTHRMGKRRWGNEPRERTKTPWAEIVRWNADAEAAGEMRRVFCASFADFFEDHPQLDEWREDVWQLVRKLRWLAFLCLTKRPENIPRSHTLGAFHRSLGSTYDLAWPRAIVRQCREAGAFPFVKQLGSRPVANGEPVRLKYRKGEEMS